jgi:hypothetical protein
MKNFFIFVLVILICSFTYYFYTKSNTKGITSVTYSQEPSTANEQPSDNTPFIENASLSNSVDNTDKKTIYNKNNLSSEHQNQSKLVEIDSLDEIVSSNDNQENFNSTIIEDLNINQLSILVNNLGQNLTSNDAAKKQDSIQDDLNILSNKNKNLLINDFQCSDNICGLIINSSNNDIKEIEDYLDQIIKTNSFKKYSKGGTLMIKKKNNDYYGIIVTSLSNKSISIK